MRDSGRVIEMASTFCPPPDPNLHRSHCSASPSPASAMLYAAPKQTWEQLKAQWKGNAWVGPGALDVDTSYNALYYVLPPNRVV